ncbi:MAG: hypothetical protein PHH49_06445 [Candidatus Omnitrophica bacterium]|nr:hypothetical protein [Candidatus Omnitrophota bacterium]MDD5488580.1 hypothetical protein [Candidatus Omnitrophota bacterium]
MRAVRILATLVILFVLPVRAFPADLSADGYDWKKYDKKEKLALVRSVCRSLDIDRKSFSPEEGVSALDHLYSAGAGRKVLKRKCSDIIFDILRGRDKPGE